MTINDRQQRAEKRREIAVIGRQKLSQSDTDPDPVYGVEALSLVYHLTRESWSLSDQEWPDYGRFDTPYRFIRNRF